MKNQPLTVDSRRDVWQLEAHFVKEKNMVLQVNQGLKHQNMQGGSIILVSQLKESKGSISFSSEVKS